ncbi:MAG: hypothetical protein HOK61_12930 [Alphaproteobacteria bacterium]|nr:hypothetical protein [Alphaproteobacteria bacterium]
MAVKFDSIQQLDTRDFFEDVFEFEDTLGAKRDEGRFRAATTIGEKVPVDVEEADITSDGATRCLDVRDIQPRELTRSLQDFFEGRRLSGFHRAGGESFIDLVL